MCKPCATSYVYIMRSEGSYLTVKNTIVLLDLGFGRLEPST